MELQVFLLLHLLHANAYELLHLRPCSHALDYLNMSHTICRRYCTGCGWPLSLTVNHWPLAASAYRLRAGSNQHPCAEL